MTNPTKRPTVRTNSQGGNFIQSAGPISITPLNSPDGWAGCMVVDVFIKKDLTQALRAALYVGQEQSGTYNVKTLDTCWIVDLPGGVFTEKERIRDAIEAFVDLKGKPPAPPAWWP